MKKFLFLFIFITMLFSFEGSLFNEVVQEGASTTDYSDITSLSGDIQTYGQFHGLLGLSVNLDTLVWADTTTNDSLIFFPQFRIAGVWITGDTVTWATVNGDTAFSDSVTILIPDSTTSVTKVAIIYPSSTTYTTIKDYPYDYFRLMRKTIGDSNYYKIDLRINTY